jgi:NADPH:quinone reductase-like Zn-dependent oxidoreductase
MRALKVGPPWGLHALEVVGAPEPSPGPGQVLVRMKAVSLNYRDLLVVNGVYPGVADGGAAGVTPFSDGCGVVEAVGAGEPLHPAALIGNSARLQGVYVGSRAMFEAMCRAMAQHQIRPVVDSVFPWTEARAAFEAMAAGRHVGKIVLTF